MASSLFASLLLLSCRCSCFCPPPCGRTGDGVVVPHVHKPTHMHTHANTHLPASRARRRLPTTSWCPAGQMPSSRAVSCRSRQGRAGGGRERLGTVYLSSNKTLLQVLCTMRFPHKKIVTAFFPPATHGSSSQSPRIPTTPRTPCAAPTSAGTGAR